MKFFLHLSSDLRCKYLRFNQLQFKCWIFCIIKLGWNRKMIWNCCSVFRCTNKICKISLNWKDFRYEKTDRIILRLLSKKKCEPLPNDTRRNIIRICCKIPSLCSSTSTKSLGIKTIHLSTTHCVKMNLIICRIQKMNPFDHQL